MTQPTTLRLYDPERDSTETLDESRCSVPGESNSDLATVRLLPEDGLTGGFGPSAGFQSSSAAADSPDQRSSASSAATPEFAGANDLELVLTAWHTATERLQKTHEVLCGEVRRLNQELEAKNRELTRKNRLADLGHMASHVAHEVRNGLAPVTLYLSLLRRRLCGDADAIRILDKLEAGFTGLEATVHDMLSFTSDRPPTWRRFGLRDLIDDVCDSLASQLSSHELTVVVDVKAGMAVWGDRDLLRRAVVNLVLNAIDVMTHGGEICITACQRGGGFELEVADSGPGIPDELAGRIFEPFFTTKSDGAGLGLAIVYRVAEAHGGDVQVANCPEGGAAFTIRIPPRMEQEAA